MARGHRTAPRLGWLPFTVYLHEFVQPDQDRDLHNHPWRASLSLVLAGGYDEERFDPDDGVVLRRVRPGRLKLIRRDDFHRIVRLRGSSTWALFITGPYVGPWGFRQGDTRQYTGWSLYLRQRGRL